MLMDQVETLHVCGYWSEILCCTITTHLSDLEVRSDVSPVNCSDSDNRIILLYKGLKGRAKIPTDDLIPKNRSCRNQHSLAFQIPSASTNAYLHSFFPQTIRDWNELPDSLISSAEMSDDCVSKFTSLMRARD